MARWHDHPGPFPRARYACQNSENERAVDARSKAWAPHGRPHCVSRGSGHPLVARSYEIIAYCFNKYEFNDFFDKYLVKRKPNLPYHNINIAPAMAIIIIFANELGCQTAYTGSVSGLGSRTHKENGQPRALVLAKENGP